MLTDLKNTTGTIFNIQRLSVNDGPGIRTIVFLKGCPLKCLWCHNPESQSTKPQIFLNARKCIGCGYCIKACHAEGHSFVEGVHKIERDRCTMCGECVNQCIGALEVSGKTITAGEAIEEVLRDRLFYEKSGGGLTVSGGEPTYQIEFTKALLMLAKENGLFLRTVPAIKQSLQCRHRANLSCF
jgi:pyruvate formate lyase activating enzyme